jgi:hypothetical protein
VQVFWCVVAVNILQLIWNAVNLSLGAWQQPKRARDIAVRAAGLIPLAVLLTARDHAAVLLKHPLLDQARLGETLGNINKAVNGVAALICAIVAVQLVWEIVQVILGFYRRRVAAA